MSLWASCCWPRSESFSNGPIVSHRRTQASTRRETPSCATFRCRRYGRAGSHADRHCHGLHTVPAEPMLRWRRSLILEGRNKCHVYACCSSIHAGSSGYAACLSNMLHTAWKCGNGDQNGWWHAQKNTAYTVVRVCRHEKSVQIFAVREVLG
jgi:hypothetical protein